MYIFPDADAAIVVGLDPDSVGPVVTILGWSKIPQQKWSTLTHAEISCFDEPGRAGCSPKKDE
jgi:hypothetical protein